MSHSTSERGPVGPWLALLVSWCVCCAALAAAAGELAPVSAPAAGNAPARSNPSATATPSTSNSSAAATTTTATTTTTTTTTPQTTSTSSTTTSRSIEEVKRIIQQHLQQTNLSENRLTVNRPQTAPLAMADFAPDSMEARVAEATARFGLAFINALPEEPRENVVLSPLSLQNLLNMVLLGAEDNAESQQELTKVLGYEATNLFGGSASSTAQDRLRPHEAMRNVFQSILQATHLSVVAQPDAVELLNTNPGSLEAPAAAPKEVAGHLQTSVREGDTPLSGQVNFTLANLVLTDKSRVTLKRDYENELKAYYNVNVEHFSNSAAANQSSGELPLHERVNSWVRNKTQNQIEKLASAEDLSGADLVLVLLNAAHFKGRWLHTFNSRATHDGTFFNGGAESGSSKAKFMRQKGVFGYADFGTAAFQNELLQGPPADVKTRPSSEDSETLLTEDDAGKAAANSPGAPNNSSGAPQVTAQTAPAVELSKEEARRLELTGRLNCSALMLPFSLNDGQELSMVILLPARRDGIQELQAALTAPALAEVYRSISEQQVQVELPKFAFEASHDAKAALLRMGLGSIFAHQRAHLSRMLEEPSSIKVDKVIHKAKISVDESGAEAAAASMASIVLRNFIRPPTPVFVADHPFLFIIRHNRSNMPLFMGRVSSL